MKRVIILFENITKNLIIDPNKKYCLYYKGCFCPPHVGHFDNIRRYIENNSNVKIIVNQLASFSRHHVHKDISVNIMKTYIKELLPIDRVSLVFRENKQNLLNHKFVKEADIFVNLRGNEKKRKYEQEFLQPVNKGVKVNKHMINKNILEQLTNNYFNKQLLQQNKYVIYYYTYRNENGPSATKFTETIIKYKNNEATYDDVIKFLPEKLQEHIKKYIISRL
jgi:phosphopantetheine adenylyltransferase